MVTSGMTATWKASPTGIKAHAGVDKDSGLIHSLVVTATYMHDLTPAADLLLG